MKEKINSKIILMIIIFIAMLVLVPNGVLAAGKVPITKTKITSIGSQVYTGKAIKPSITVKYKGKKLKKNKNYTISYSNNKKIGTATITIKGKGSYNGTVKKSFSIVPKKVTGIKVTKKATNSITLGWKKVSGVTGYKIYTYNKSNKSYKYVGKTSKTSYKVNNLKQNTNYKYRIRAYKTIKNKQYLGPNSGIMSVVTKKAKVTTGEKNALSRAKSYLRYMSFSYQGLFDQLKFEKFTDKEAKYGVDNCGANWNEQAVKKAKSYLKTSAFSYEGLIGQLEFEGFTSKQAKYGVDKCKVNWNEQAVKKAKSYLKTSAFSYEGLIGQLEYEGFTEAQAKYGVDQCKVNWNEQAVKKAKSYLKYMSFSYEELIDQLEYEGFTEAQAKYGANNCGVNW